MTIIAIYYFKLVTNFVKKAHGILNATLGPAYAIAISIECPFYRNIIDMQ